MYRMLRLKLPLVDSVHTTDSQKKKKKKKL
jgi:hypothetical protein